MVKVCVTFYLKNNFILFEKPSDLALCVKTIVITGLFLVTILVAGVTHVQQILHKFYGLSDNFGQQNLLSYLDP
jgi:hypothetical protein